MCDSAAQPHPFPPTIQGVRVSLRSATPLDLPRFVEITAQPEVSAWWMRQEEARLRCDMFESDDVTTYAIELAGDVIGAILCSEEDDPDYRFASVDIFLDSAHLGQGLGSDALRAMLRWLFTGRCHHRVTIDPAVANVRARRAYEKVGFRPVGVMRRYERGSDLVWRDALLMDLLAEELE